MNIDALPYAVYLLLAELGVGSLIVLLFADARGLAERSFVKYSAAQTVVVGALVLPLSWWVANNDIATGYPVRAAGLDGGWWSLLLFFGCTAVYAMLTFGGWRRGALATGAAGVACGLAGLSWLAYGFAQPVWSFPAMLASAWLGALATGGVTLAMVLGHWYLVTPRLSNRPLNELTLLALGALVAQTALLALNLAMPVDVTLDVTTVLGQGLAANPALWLRAGVGLALAGVCVGMAHVSSRESSMMSATGLLYIAMGAALAGEVLARGVLFATAVPV